MSDIIKSNILLLDVENTLIESFFKPTTLLNNIFSIRKFIYENNIDKIVIFSYGLDTKSDFIKNEKLFNYILNTDKKISCITVNECIDIVKVKKVTPIIDSLDFFEMGYADKRLFLLEYANFIFSSHTNVILIDDSFSPCKIELVDDITINCLKIKDGTLTSVKSI